MSPVLNTVVAHPAPRYHCLSEAILGDCLLEGRQVAYALVRLSSLARSVSFREHREAGALI